MAELSRPFPDIHVLFYIVNVLEGGSISEENTGESCIWLRFLFPEKVAHDLVLNFCRFFVDSVNSDFYFDREDFNSLAAEGKATLIFNCIQYAIAKVSKKNKIKKGKMGREK